MDSQGGPQGTMEEVTMENAVSVKMEQDYVNQQILLFYVDEGGGNEQSIITTVEDMQQAVPIDPAQNYYIGETPMDAESDNNYIMMDAGSIIVDNTVYTNLQDIWSETDEKRLLVFYIDNKETFLEGVTKETFLWSVACKTMLMGKTPEACKLKLESLRIKYKEILQKHSLHVTTETDVQWPYFVLAHQAFHNEVGDPNCDSDNENLADNPSNSLTNTLYDVGNANILKDETVVTNQMRVRECNEGNERLIIKRPAFNEQIFRSKSNNADASVLTMLDLYLQLQNVENLDTKTKWEVIADKMGENNREYWYKRFLNYRQHYITLLEKHGSDQANITWPYMEIFNELFKDDEKFQQKYNFKDSTESHSECEESTQLPKQMAVERAWSTPEMVILVKHYFDYYDEHQDLTLPKQFLWSEIGRLLDKDPDECKSQYEVLRVNHLNKYIKGGYKTSQRDPLSILYDHIISMDVKNQMFKLQLSKNAKVTKDIDNHELVMFFYENMELFKDEMCYFVCWAAVALKLNASLKNCLLNWYALKAVYKSNLNQRKSPETLGSTTWVYMDAFDKIFNNGTDATMLFGYERLPETKIDDKSNNTGTDIEYINLDENTKITKILNYYATNKKMFDKLPATISKWKDLSQEIGLTNRECAKELNKLKTKYLEILESGIDETSKRSLWKYYEVCSKIFGPNPKLNRRQQKSNESDSEFTIRKADVDVDYLRYEKSDQKVRRATNNKVNKGPVKIIKWTEKSRELLLTLYLRQLKTNRYTIIDSHKMWRELSIKLNKPPEQCKKMFVKLKRLNQSSNDTCKYKGLIDEILSIKCNFQHPVVVYKKRVDYKNVELPMDVLEKALEYYFKNLEEFVSERYSKLYSWRQLSKMVNESVYKLYQKINYLKTNYDELQDSSFAIILNLILEKEKDILKSDVKITAKRGRSKVWSEEERNKLMELYCSFKENFSNPKNSKKYLWHKIGLELNRSYKDCRKEFLHLQSTDAEENG